MLSVSLMPARHELFPNLLYQRFKEAVCRVSRVRKIQICGFAKSAGGVD